MEKSWKSDNLLYSLKESYEDFDSIIESIFNQDLSKYKSMSEEEAIESLKLKNCVETTGYYGDTEYLSARIFSWNLDYDLPWVRFACAAKGAGLLKVRVCSKEGYSRGAYRDTSYSWEGKDKTFIIPDNSKFEILWFDCNPEHNELFIQVGHPYIEYRNSGFPKNKIKELEKRVLDNFS